MTSDASQGRADEQAWRDQVADAAIRRVEEARDRVAFECMVSAAYERSTARRTGADR